MTALSGPDQALPTPLSVCVLVAPGAAAVEAPVAELRREAIAVEVVGIAELRQHQRLEQEVVLVWAPPAAASELLQHVVAWARRSGAPVLGCSPDGGPADAERALVAGFDDWVAGRASPRELVARVRALARRRRQSRAASPARLRWGRLVLDVSRHEAELAGRRHLLTPTEFALLRVLVEARGAVVERERLLDLAWGADPLEVGVPAVDNVVARLRRKLELEGLVLSVRGVGYRLTSE